MDKKGAGRSLLWIQKVSIWWRGDLNHWFI